MAEPVSQATRGTVFEVTKRAFDLLTSALALVILSPLMLAIAVWIRLDSSGPVMFRQVRVGQFGRPFRIHKFRTMEADAPLRGSSITVHEDPRITRAGRILRRYKLDELPQLIDVLMGRMSLVGPRPEVPKYVESYPSHARELVQRLRPGITDPASLEFIDEEKLLSQASNPEDAYLQLVLPRKVSLYMKYAQSATFAGDVKILLRTIAAIFCR